MTFIKLINDFLSNCIKKNTESQTTVANIQNDSGKILLEFLYTAFNFLQGFYQCNTLQTKARIYSDI